MRYAFLNLSALLACSAKNIVYLHLVQSILDQRSFNIRKIPGRTTTYCSHCSLNVWVVRRVCVTWGIT